MDPPVRQVVTASLTLGAAVGVFALAFGVGAVGAGGSVAQACAMSLLVFTGASQFSAVSVIAAGGTTTAALGGAMILAARNGVYGLAMSRLIGGSLARRLAAAHLVIDESTAMATAQRTEHEQRVAFWITGLTVFICWNVATLLGALAGEAIDPPDVGPRRGVPRRVRGDGRPPPALPHRPPRRGCSARRSASCSSPSLPVGLPILCSSAAILVGIPATRRRHDAPPRHGGGSMTWTLVLLLGVGAYACKATGLVVLGSRHLPPVVERCLALVPAALICALIVQNTFSTGNELVLDARAAGVGAAAIAAWRRAPLVVVIVLGAAVTALVRQVA